MASSIRIRVACLIVGSLWEKMIGGSASPPELLARVGLDITDPGFWDGGLALLAEMVDEAEALAKAS